MPANPGSHALRPRGPVQRPPAPSGLQPPLVARRAGDRFPALQPELWAQVSHAGRGRGRGQRDPRVPPPTPEARSPATRGSRLHPPGPSRESGLLAKTERTFRTHLIALGRGGGWGRVAGSCLLESHSPAQATLAVFARPSPAVSWVQGRDGTGRDGPLFYCSHSSERAPSKRSLLVPAFPTKRRALLCRRYPGWVFCPC